MAIIEILFSIGNANDHMKVNSDDLVYSLEKNLRKKYARGKVIGEFKGGVFRILVSEHTIETVKPYIDAFTKAMRRDDEPFFVNMTTREISDLDSEIMEMKPSGEIFPAHDMARIQFKQKMARSTSELRSLLSNKKKPKKIKK